MFTEVKWKTKGGSARHITNVPDGEDYRDWIAQMWGLDRDDIEILGTV